MSIADTASRLLETFGEPIQFSYVAGDAYDPATGGNTGGSTVTITGSGYPSGYRNREQAGQAVEAGDIRLVCEKITERPEVDWLCLVNGNTFRVMDVQPIRKSGADIIYICQLRK